MQNQIERPIHTIDLKFKGIDGLIAVYLILHDQGAMLVETGPGSTIPLLQAGLRSHGIAISDITDVFITHIHLDHAGASGWLARQGARIHVHAKGAPHLVNPEKLLSSAFRLYGDEMQSLWGEFLPVPEDRICVLRDSEIVEICGLKIKPLETPGHASHHFAYIFQDVCFTGDIGGVRMDRTYYIRLPMPPPEIHLEQWKESARRLKEEYSRGSFKRIAPTHFGIFHDPNWHLSALEQTLDEIQDWVERVMPANPPIEEITDKFVEWEKEHAYKSGISDSQAKALNKLNPSWMSAIGIRRYWEKVRNAPVDEPTSETQRTEKI